jgi:CheY-like chemotaxis protein
MPNKEGLATLRELRRLNPTVPVIMMSGGAEHLVSGNRARRLSRDGEKAWRHPDNQETFKYSQLNRLVRECLAAAHRRQ